MPLLQDTDWMKIDNFSRILQRENEFTELQQRWGNRLCANILHKLEICMKIYELFRHFVSVWRKIPLVANPPLENSHKELKWTKEMFLCSSE